MDYEQLMREFTRCDVTKYVAAADNHSATPLVLIAAKTGYRIRVQKIVIAVTTTAATTQVIQSIAANVPLAAVAASPALAPPLTWDFGTKGAVVADSDGLDYLNSGAGVACAIVVQAYYEPIPST